MQNIVITVVSSVIVDCEFFCIYEKLDNAEIHKVNLKYNDP